MTRRERLMATLRGEPVDRPAVSFYEIGGFTMNPDDPDEFNVYNGPTWRPLLELAENESDVIRMVTPGLRDKPGSPSSEFITTETYIENGSRFVRTKIEVAGRTLTSLTRRDPGLDTIWCIEHLLKDVDDLKAYLELPDEVFDQEVDLSHVAGVDAALGDKGIVMMETPDPLCIAAMLFSMEDFTVIAYTERELFHALLRKIAGYLHPRVEQITRDCPGQLWRVFGPEYASEPYLPPHLFKEYVVDYTTPIVRSIAAHGGYARLHCHGRLRSILHHIVSMGVAAIDPIEPPPQGDVELAFVRKEYGRDLVLFGNLEVTDIENLDPSDFEKVVACSLADGMAGEGRGFVLMPSSAPYGRAITPRALENYRTMIRLAQGMAG